MKLFKKLLFGFVLLLLLTVPSIAGTLRPVIGNAVYQAVWGVTGYGGEDTEDFTGLYWGTARTAYWTDTRVALWTTTRITEVP